MQPQPPPSVNKVAKLQVIPTSDGGISVVEIIGDDPGGLKLTKTLFELSRTTDRTTHFDPAVHTREAVGAGIPGHRALAITAECEDSDLPSDRYFRNAWEWSEMDTGGAPKVNMTKARAIHMDVIREARNAELIKTDLPFMRAVETGDTNAQAMITSEKQTLRDIPQTFDLTARTPAQLMSKWPVELPPRTD